MSQDIPENDLVSNLRSEEIREGEWTFDEIFNHLITNDEVILDQLEQDDIPRLRRGLSNYKSRLNTRYEKQGLPLEERTLEFETLETYENKTIKLRVYFFKVKGIKAKLIPADGSLN